MNLQSHIESDLNTFFSTDDFATAATIDGKTVKGIFDNAYIEDLDVSGTIPVFVCKKNDVSDVSQGDPVEIGETSYQVASIEPDGTGVTRLVLEEI